MIHITTLKPDYYDKFHCACGDCRHNCCSYPWRITVDKQTYKSYQKMKCSPELAANLKKYIVKEDFPTNETYAVLKQEHDPKTRCVFQDENGLCGIQVEFGYQYLCNTCKVYPRTALLYRPSRLQEMGIFFEYSMSSGCEAVGKLLYDNHDPIEMIAVEEDVIGQNLYTQSNLSLITFDEKDRKIYSHFFQIQATAIGILQDRELCFEDRLILLGMFIYKLQKLEDDGREDDVPAEIEKFVNGVDEKSFAETFNNIRLDYVGKLDILMIYCNSLSIAPEEVWGTYSRRFEQFFNKNETVDERCYRLKLMTESQKEYFKDKEYFFENIFVNFLIQHNGPFFEGLNMTQSYHTLIGNYIIFRLVLTFYIGTDKDISENELIDLTSMLGRTTMNSPTTIKSISTLFDKPEINSIAQLAMLIK